MIKLSFLHPNVYSSIIPLEGGVKGAIFFFLANFAIGLFLRVILTSIISLNPTIIFLGITSIVFLAIPAIISLIVISAALHLLAKILGGKGSFQSSLGAVAYSLIFLIFFWIPFADLVAYFFMLYVLTLTFSRAHQYSLVKAGVNVAVPFLITIILSVVLGLVNSNSVLTGQ